MSDFQLVINGSNMDSDDDIMELVYKLDKLDKSWEDYIDAM